MFLGERIDDYFCYLDNNSHYRYDEDWRKLMDDILEKERGVL